MDSGTLGKKGHNNNPPMIQPPIPAPLWQRLQAFLAEEKTGSVTLHVKQGKVLAWEVTEVGRIGGIDNPNPARVA